MHTQMLLPYLLIHTYMHALQIADFGMSCDLIDESYYVTSGGKVPVKWTAPEVGKKSVNDHLY